MNKAVSMKDCNAQSLQDAAVSYNVMGYKIICLKPRSKQAKYAGWSDPDYQDSSAHWMTKGNEEFNIGMPLGRNHLYVIDIDSKNEYLKSMNAIADELVERTGVDTMFWESETIGISSGKPGSGKLLFTVPAWAADHMKYHRINWQNRKSEFHSVVEFRCGNGFQDVMPPSIHPSGTTYQFVGGDDALEMPADLLYLACCWNAISEKLLSANPDYVKPLAIRSKSGKPYEGEDYAQIWCEKESLYDWLVSCGYTPAGSNRFLSPSSTSGSPGVMLFDGGRKFWSFGASDPFCDGRPHCAYDLLWHYKCGRSYKESWKYILHDLGVDRVKNNNRSASWS